jgi:type IV secretion system protein VirB9
MERSKTLTIVSAAVALALASTAHAQTAPAAKPAATGAPTPPSLAYAGTTPAAAAAPVAAASGSACKVAAPVSCDQAAPAKPKPAVHHVYRPRRDDTAEEVRKLRALYDADQAARKAEEARKAAEAAAMGTDAAAEARAWQAGKKARPVMGADGLLQYPYGEGQPQVTCAPLRACDIQLQAGEVINNVILGDTVRWIPAPAKTGDGALAVPHVIVKPTEPGLTTNLIVTTNRRTYTLTLNSSNDTYVSRVGFYYPADMVQNWNGEALLAQRKAEEDAKRKVSDMPITSIDQLNLDGYKLKGDKDLPWYPVRVFDDGTHVWIQMPNSIHSNEAPALVLLDKHGDSELVNYRVKEAEQGGQKVTYYIVDKLFDRAGLIVGVGGDQKKVEIIKRKSSDVATNWTTRYDN